MFKLQQQKVAIHARATAPFNLREIILAKQPSLPDPASNETEHNLNPFARKCTDKFHSQPPRQCLRWPSPSKKFHIPPTIINTKTREATAVKSDREKLLRERRQFPHVQLVPNISISSKFPRSGRTRSPVVRSPRETSCGGISLSEPEARRAHTTP